MVFLIFTKMGLPEAPLFAFFLWLPVIPLLPISIVLFKREQKKQPGLDFKKRFRLNKLKKKDWLWVISGIILTFVFENIIMEPVSRWMAAIPFLSPPDHFPAFINPLKEVELPLTQFLGVSLKVIGQSYLLLLFFIL